MPKVHSIDHRYSYRGAVKRVAEKLRSEYGVTIGYAGVAARIKAGTDPDTMAAYHDTIQEMRQEQAARASMMREILKAAKEAS